MHILRNQILTNNSINSHYTQLTQNTSKSLPNATSPKNHLKTLGKPQHYIIKSAHFNPITTIHIYPHLTPQTTTSIPVNTNTSLCKTTLTSHTTIKAAQTLHHHNYTPDPVDIAPCNKPLLNLPHICPMGATFNHFDGNRPYYNHHTTFPTKNTKLQNALDKS